MAESERASTSNDSPNPYLTRPSTSTTGTTTASSSSSSSSSSATTSKGAEAKHETRLYVGNLHTTVDEYTLIQTFAKYGKIAKLDFLFHKSGPQRGQPRGYAFVEYAHADEALRALAATHGKTLRGRRIAVSFASKTADADQHAAAAGVGAHRRDRRAGHDGQAARTTQLSLSKNAKQPHSTDAKIAAMEAKLAHLRKAKSTDPSGPPATGIASLPPKPAFTARKHQHRP
ncbi:hypothetical protein L1887_63121 [Cichorium endivia]|nr:hypothetical protein L1887_63121 [Cichorium endivia]